jgi:hypothetical protein
MELSKYYLKTSDALLADATGPLISRKWNFTGTVRLLNFSPIARHPDLPI